MDNDKYKKYASNFSLEHLLEYSGHLAQLERRSSYDDFERSSQYCVQALKEAGFSQIERIAHPADGKSCCWDCIMPQAWDLTGRSTLQIVEGDVPEGSKMLADSDVNPLHALIWSAPTPPEGITCELVDYDSLDAAKSDCHGKWVFFTGADGSSINTKVYHQLAEAGAAGLLVTGFSASEYCPSDLFWTNGQGRTGWYHAEGDRRLPCFAISPARGRQLLRELASGTIIVHAQMQSKIYDGEIFTITAVIPGESEEEYALLAHIYEPFEADDAIGFAIACDFGHQLLARKIKPKKTLRVIFSMELYGMAAFLNNPKYRNKIIGAMNLDVFTTRAAPELRCRFSPAAIASCLDWHWYDWVKKALPTTTIVPEYATLSDDTFCGDPHFGIPANWLYTESGIFHHNTGAFFTPDWPKLKERLPVLYMGLEEILMEELPDYSTRADEDFRWAAELISSSNSLTCYEKNVRVQTEYCRALQRLKSQKQFGQATFSPQKLNASRDKVVAGLASLSPDRLSTVEKMADSIVVGNCQYGFPFSLAHVPWKERRNVSLPRALWALFDGKRTLLNAIRIFDAEAALPLLVDKKVTPEFDLASTRTSDEQIEHIVNELRYVAQYGYCSLTTTTQL